MYGLEQKSCKVLKIGEFHVLRDSTSLKKAWNGDTTTMLERLVGKRLEARGRRNGLGGLDQFWEGIDAHEGDQTLFPMKLDVSTCGVGCIDGLSCETPKKFDSKVSKTVSSGIS